MRTDDPILADLNSKISELERQIKVSDDEIVRKRNKVTLRYCITPEESKARDVALLAELQRIKRERETLLHRA